MAGQKKLIPGSSKILKFNVEVNIIFVSLRKNEFVDAASILGGPHIKGASWL